MAKITKLSCLSNYCVPQHGKYWCIPATIENILKSENINNVSQEDIIVEHIRESGLKFSNNGVEEKSRELIAQDIIDYYREEELHEANFETFAKSTNRILIKIGESKRLTFDGGI